MLKYFKGSILSAVIGLLLAAGVGWYYNGTLQAATQAFFIAAVLAILEISLSFDNAIVNAVVLSKMNQVWQKRFLTWGMIIAVFGMRLVFPLLIVSIMGKVSPWSALVIAATQPDQYAAIMLKAHLPVAAFGGAFLLMVALHFFYDQEKEVHWISWIEKPLSYFGRMEAVEVAVALFVLLLITFWLPDPEQLQFLTYAIVGVITFVCVNGVGSFLEVPDQQMQDFNKASAGLFVYLEVLDASFSFDGVVGAFAITHNLFIIMLGLSIGAFFVRSLTILFVEKKTLSEFAFLEHGAFYAIGLLAIIMLSDSFMHIPEWVTGVVGALVIVIAFIWSLLFAPSELSNKKPS